MTLEWLGTAGIVVSVAATSIFVIGYLVLAPWYRSRIGISLMFSKSWICGISWLAAMRYLFGLGDGSDVYLALRAVLWATLPFMSVLTLWALLIGQQVKSSRKGFLSSRGGENGQGRKGARNREDVGG